MTEDGYLQTLEATRTAALASVSAMSLSDQLRQVASFHETADRMAQEQFGGRATAVSQYHALLGKAAAQAAIHLEGRN